MIEDTVAYALLQAVKATRASISPALAANGLHPGQDLLLSALWSEDGITQAELVERLGIRSPTVSKALTRLERVGYVRREIDANRSRRVYLTPTGRALRQRSTITSAFTPSLIGLSDSGATALSFTITNPNTSGTLSAVAFTDTLPAGLAVDDPNGENGTCGTASVITATPATQAISLSGGSIKAAASCTFSVSVTAAQTGTFQNTTSAVSSSAGAGSAGSAATLTVIPPPTVTVSHIKQNAKYRYGQVFKPTYSCTQPDDAAGRDRLHRAAEQPVHHREGQAQAPWRAPVPTCAPGRR
jgi:DNA-binding MarR family transcriptional regulator